MPINYINTGSSPNKGDGDTLRTAFNKINANFKYLNQSTGVQANADLAADVFLNNNNHTGISVSYNTSTAEASLTLLPATTSTLGGVKAGLNVTIESDGTLNAGVGSPATRSTIGGVIVGDNMNVDSSGTLTANNLGNFVFSGDTLENQTSGTIILKTGLKSIVYDPLANTISVPESSTILSGSNDTFNIRNVRQIQFADGTTQQTAGVGTIILSTLTNGSYKASLGSTGTFTVPGDLEIASSSYSVFTNPVSNSSTAVISAGFGATPQAGWKFNGYTIISVTPGTGNYSLELPTAITIDGGTYPLQPVPGFGGSLRFPDDTEQTTAWTGSYVATTSTDWSSPAPTTIAEAIDRLAAVVKILNSGTGA